MANVATSSPAAEAWALMQRLFAPQRRRFMALAAEYELSPPQLGALKALDSDNPLAMSELAEVLGCDNSNVTGIVDRLEDRGLVERRPGERDRRVKMLTITGRGAQIRDALGARLSEPPEPLASLPPDDQVALRDIMRRALGRA
jgi:MarR family transcriptional regulator, organic hydroperoxide resistance regulator